MNDARPSNSPGHGRPFGVTDEQLSAELKQWTGSTPALHPVGELLDRHWEAAFAYARLCTDGPRAAGMLTTAAFTRLFGESLRQAGPTSAWRSHLLVTVRRIAAEWAGDGRQEQLHPALLSGAVAAGERPGALLLPPSDRRLLSRAFQRLPQSSRAVLWHTEVESEPLSIPAGLLGLDEEGARAELRRARERLREECLQVHRELAAEDECLRYVRMLDVTSRRGDLAVDPDLQAHLNRCTHCRHTADQLAQFNGFIGAALAEAVLGWGAQAYVESRAGLTGETAEQEPPQAPAPAPAGGESFTAAAPVPGEAAAATASGPSTRDGARRPAPGSRTGAPRPAPADGTRSRRSAQRAARRARRRNLAVAVATVSGLVVLPLVVWSVLSSGDGSAPAAGAGSSRTPGSGPSASGPSWIGTGETAQGQGTLAGRLRNAGSGLCVGVVGKKAVEGAETELAKCSSAASQRWTYESDGLLRNAATPDLCLDSHLGYSVRLAPCAGTSRSAGKNVRYDFTLQGALVPRWNQDLALSPAATDGAGALVLKTRANTKTQHWVIDTSNPDLQMEVVNWDADRAQSAPPRAGATPKAARTPTPAPTPPAPRPTASGTADACSAYPYYCSWDGRNGDWNYGSGGSYGSGGGHRGR
ncbi:ricin-type beta-trefoil lectin domain protein [Streptomyces sp. NPDC058964]|uniref:ricin-type beta-trefoil lectin domain protein n=1 Tax=Streptomyces sp. NPDC058964 TaxID=3346681 RepID=UPI0036D003A7